MVVHPHNVIAGQIDPDGKGLIVTKLGTRESYFLHKLYNHQKMNRGLFKGFGYDGAVTVTGVNVLEDSDGAPLMAEYYLLGRT